MSDQATAKRALAYILGELRPDWTNPDSTGDLRLKGILDALGQTSKPLADLAVDAIDAARTPNLKSPRILVTHRAPARPINPQAQQPPKVAYCGKCNRPLDEGIEHTCVPAGRSTKPDWWDEAQAITNRYAQRIKDARDLQDYEQVAELQAERDCEVDALLGDQ